MVHKLHLSNFRSAEDKKHMMVSEASNSKKIKVSVFQAFKNFEVLRMSSFKDFRSGRIEVRLCQGLEDASRLRRLRRLRNIQVKNTKFS